ncbi:hypothetical protein AB0D11_00695 [Streptomyces monashensis]|uniref:hypothetical protein n=1 Tax=Streptomyces monashensis TaxID=1678012 RepID=UPI0033F5AA3D
MSCTRRLLRSGPVLAAALALPAGQAVAESGISVNTVGSTVSVATSACTRTDGGWGSATLLTGRRTNTSAGRRTTLAGTTAGQSATWSGVRPGTYTVVVVCSGGSTAGTRPVLVPSASGTSSAAPALGIMGGLGSAARDYGPLTLGIGAALVGSGVVATGRYLRRR